MKSKGKVLLGMSGGVDSSVSAYILKQQGYEVIGCTMKLWFDENHNKYVSNIEDAKRVANTLDIPFHIFDMQEDFKKYVVNYFISEYESGRTPNPCVACNRYVKFEGLMEKAKELEIDYIATGHYAVVEKENDRYILKKSKDDSKDQTYFLYNLTQEQLSKAVFPLGSYKKTEIRDIAKQLGFNTANKPDSQEVCFIENNNHFEFVNAYSDTPTQKGEIVDIQGNVLGIHEGISKYTIGQRRGLGVVTGKPMFVIDIDGESNRVILGSNDDLLKKELIASNLNWVSIDSLKDKLDVDIKIRSTAKLAKGKISTIEENKVRVIFDKPQRAITKGQSVVFYKEDTVVGGGIIES
ncbi:MAG: tRNA 2-thiouridine(34) synthase MnmA [Candidatus Dojkabacteria bacterium]|nr:tRNA 2-thiouridine(34) synthase MnmA [Candidatus Dojkabacteria bacterium]